VSAVWIPADRFLSVADQQPDLARRVEGTGADRRIRELRSGRQQFVSLEVADRILTGLDLNHWFHMPAADGGLADIYVDGAQYGAPSNVPVSANRTVTRYATDEERVEAKRRAWRESKRRSLQRREAA
jgi:hypothetical protein